ncbi:MAG: acyltransferase family protein [Clostridium baratii]|uniref:acyltransferase n=1 Tax=Clostridium baratii TaxID=1561 RepID=UPI00242F8A3F|nr:acyltransferase family protein [Clostridium baratii]MBS6007244.1 acyltransferase family protein [Clostridium baratii]
MRNISLDYLKVLACFCVVTLHVVGNDVSVVNSCIYYTATLAVPIFFMVNGNLLLNRKHIDYKYVLNKIKKIILVILSWNIIICIIRFLLKSEFINPFMGAIKNLIQEGYFPIFWFFGSLIIIYSALPIIHKIFKKTKNAIVLVFICILITFSVDFTSVLRSILGKSIIQIHCIQTLRIWTWMTYFLIGGLLGKENIKQYLIKKINLKLNIFIVSLLTILSVMYQFYIAKFVYKLLYAEYFYDNMIILLWIVSIFFLMYRININRESKYSNIVLRNSIGIYIIHMTIIQIFSKIYDFRNSIINIIMIFIIFIFSLITSIIISKIPILKNMVRL